MLPVPGSRQAYAGDVNDIKVMPRSKYFKFDKQMFINFLKLKIIILNYTLNIKNTLFKVY